MMDGVLKIRGPRRVCFQEIMGCFNFGFWMMDCGLKTILNFGFWIFDGIQNLEFKIYHSLLPLGIFGGGFDDRGEDFLNALDLLEKGF
jgi:hypothetical protein